MENNRQEEMRDSEGNLINYSSKPGCAYGEVLGVKLDKRMDRIESNLGDARVEIKSLAGEVDHVKGKVNGICTMLGELTGKVSTYIELQKEAGHECRIRSIEKHVAVVRGVSKIGCAIIGVLGTAFGIFKFWGGK